MEPPAPPPPADALSSLPDDLVDDSILTRLDLRDVVRTSALNRAWQHRWESLPALSLPLHDEIGTPAVIVDSVLSRYDGRIPHFSIRINPQSACRVKDWLIDLSHRAVQFLDIRGIYAFDFNVHPSIYSFSHLVTLKLHRCIIKTRPVGFAGFPLLKELELVDAQLSDKDLEAIVHGSPLLDALMLSDVYVHVHHNEVGCVIEAPNLCSLTIISVVVYGWQFGGLPRLDNATIDLDTYMYEGGFGEFLARVAHARKLTLTFYQPRFGDDTLLETLPYKFVNLRSLFLWTHFCELYSILATFCLLRNSPHLEELEIIINGDQEQEIEANEEFQNTQWTNGMSANLQVVTINDISCLSNEMCFIGMVLSKATALRTIYINLEHGCSRSNEDVRSELNAYIRASPHAQFIVQRCH